MSTNGEMQMKEEEGSPYVAAAAAAAVSPPAAAAATAAAASVTDSPMEDTTTPTSTPNTISAINTKEEEDDDDEDDDDDTVDGDQKPPAAAAAAAAAAALTTEDENQQTTDTKSGSATTTPGSTSTTKPKKKKRRGPGGPGTASALNKTYMQLIQEGIMDMKDYRNGSSLAAIKKWILSKYPDLGGPHFASRINTALKNGTTSKPPKFDKIRGSYKIAKEFKEAARNKKRRAAAALKRKNDETKKKRKQKKKQKEQQKMNQKQQQQLETQGSMTKEEAEALEKRMKREEAARIKAQAEAKAKQQRTEKLRRRRFPMEDTKLHKEDKELNVKPPPDVYPRPYLPYFWNTVLPIHHPRRKGKTTASILAASKVDNLDIGSNGLIPDLLSVYHFFRGDVHFQLDETNPIVPEFTLQNLIFAVEQVQNGNAKRYRQVPPLLVHLFVTCLQILLGDMRGNGGSEYDTNRNEALLFKDLNTFLLPALSPASWSDVVYLYMDAMERYYTTDVSRETNVLPPLPTDLEYLLGRTDEPTMTTEMILATPVKKKSDATDDEAATGSNVVTNMPLPEGYNGYLGDTRSALCRGHFKLARQDPWLLTAEELVALLRALTQDVLATHPAANMDMANREGQMQELLRAKRSADMKFRKVRLAHEGPKRPNRPKKSDENNDNATENGKNEEKNGDGDPEEKVFKPTATKKQFEAAKRAQERASEAYEKGIRSLVARTEPVGYDRNFNAVYCFRHDPEVLYVEDRRSPAAQHASNLPTDMQEERLSWHVIETTSLFDKFVGSLDIRGKREHDLYEELVGPPGSHQSLRRFLHDDIQEKANARAKIKEKEALKERLEIARVKCDEEKGRRSGRIAGRAEMELSAIQSELDDLEREAQGKKVPDAVRDYTELTGLVALRKFEMAGRVETRRTREKRADAEARKLPILRCSKLCSTGHIDGSGAVGMVVSGMLELEEHCESLVSWERNDMTRSAWITGLEGAVSAWNSISQEALGSPAPARSAAKSTAASPLETEIPTGSASKRRKLESPVPSTPSSFSLPTVNSILNTLKQPLLDLEERVAELTNVDVATRDADLADDNMSTDSTEDQSNKERLERAWKKPVYKLRQTATRRHSQIRGLLVSAIGAARKAHLPQVVAQLRAALLLYHPNAASDCKTAAIKVLEAHGDYEANEDEDSDEEEEEADDSEDKETAPSVMSAEACILGSSLGGSEDADRKDWVGMVKSSKTISRFAGLAAAFTSDAMEKINKLQVERDELTRALQAWTKAEERAARGVKAGKNPSNQVDGTSEVWANVRFTDEIVMAKAEEYPWWPAKICEARDPKISESLEGLSRTLVAFIGEMGGLRVVKKENIKPFTGKVVDEGDEVQYKKEQRTELDDCMAMARRIIRGRKRPSKRGAK